MKALSVIGTIGKGVGIIFLGLIILFILFILIVMIITKSNNAYKGDYKAIVKNDDSNAPKALVVYQPSKSDDSKNIADQLAKGLNESGYEVTLTYPGKHVSDEISQYSLISFGSPVFFGKPSEILTKTILRMKDLSDKKVILYSVGKLSDGPELEEVKKSLNGKEPDYTVKFCTKDNEEKQAYELGLKAGRESRERK